MSRLVRNMKGGNACVIAALCVCGGAEGQLSFQLESNQPLSLFTHELPRPNSHISSTSLSPPSDCTLLPSSISSSTHLLVVSFRSFM